MGNAPFAQLLKLVKQNGVVWRNGDGGAGQVTEAAFGGAMLLLADGDVWSFKRPRQQWPPFTV